MSDQQFHSQPMQAQARLAAIVESSDDAIVSKTLQGIITSWNKGAERIFGYTADEIIGLPMTTLFPPERHDEEPRILERISRGERVEHFETVRVTKDGRLVDVSVSISPLRDESNRIIGASKIARDITRQKQTERDLRLARDAAEAARRAAEEATRAKDHFISVLSHELRTPLTPVLASVNLLETLTNVPEAELRHHLDVIRRNVETEARLVDDLLDVTRITQNKIRLHPERLDVHAAVRGVVAMLQSEIDQKRLEVTFALRAAGRTVMADPGRFQQVLLNLLSNAVKFTPEDGAIIVRSSNDENGRLVLALTDTGVGIDPATLPRLFKPFEQGERTLVRQFGGLGLGLSIARSLIELHGGTIEAYSAGRGKGATFTIRVPTADEALPHVVNRVSPPQPSALQQACHVLLVEDHDDTRDMLCRLLSSFGCTVTTAGTVRQAEDLFEAAQFDLLVSDIGLPDGSGLDVMRQLRQRQDTPGIALSGFGQDDDLARSLAAGFREHLIKPVNVQTLRDAVMSARA